MNPKGIYFQWYSGWIHGAGCRPIDPFRSEHGIKEMRDAYNNGYTEGRLARDKAGMTKAKELGVEVSTIRTMEP